MQQKVIKKRRVEPQGEEKERLLVTRHKIEERGAIAQGILGHVWHLKIRSWINSQLEVKAAVTTHQI